MDDGWFFVMVIIGIVAITLSGIIIHELIETPYDKCLDTCLSNSLDGNQRVVCVGNCERIEKCSEIAVLTGLSSEEKKHE